MSPIIYYINFTVKAYQTAVTNAKKDCVKAFGNCNKLKASSASIISACNTNGDALKVKAKALTKNAESTKKVAAKVSTVGAAATAGLIGYLARRTQCEEEKEMDT